jgi:ribosomal protein L7/L12
MSWAKIEIEFRPEEFGVAEVMNALFKYFEVDGIPKATILLRGTGPDELDPSGSTDIERLADQIWLTLQPKKIEAIKEMRRRSGLGLKDAKDAIDRAYQRNPNP